MSHFRQLVEIVRQAYQCTILFHVCLGTWLHDLRLQGRLTDVLSQSPVRLPAPCSQCLVVYLERIEEKLDKQPVQTEQGKSEDNGNLEEAIMPLVDSMNRTNRNLCVLRDGLKIISDRQKESKKELVETISSKLEALSAKDDKTTVDEIRALRQFIVEQINKPQHKKVIHDLTTKTWWLVGIGVVLFFCMSLLTTKIYDQSKEIEELQLADWKYRALRATLPANNANVIWLEHNVWAGNKDGIRHCQQFVINYEDSIRRRYQMEHEAAMRDNIGRLMIQQSKDIRKKLK